jgi:predicted small metal-binding protein
MSKRMKCADVGMDCDFAALADTEEELLELVREHARRVHGIDEVTPDLKRKVLDAVEDV